MMFADYFSLIPWMMFFTGQFICHNWIALQSHKYKGLRWQCGRFFHRLWEHRKTHLGILSRFRQVGGPATRSMCERTCWRATSYHRNINRISIWWRCCSRQWGRSLIGTSLDGNRLLRWIRNLLQEHCYNTNTPLMERSHLARIPHHKSLSYRPLWWGFTK